VEDFFSLRKISDLFLVILSSYPTLSYLNPALYPPPYYYYPALNAQYAIMLPLSYFHPVQFLLSYIQPDLYALFGHVASTLYFSPIVNESGAMYQEVGTPIRFNHSLGSAG
jgi:hypothetical protein